MFFTFAGASFLYNLIAPMGSSRPLAGCAIVKTDFYPGCTKKGKTIVTTMAVVLFFA